MWITIILLVLLCLSIGYSIYQKRKIYRQIDCLLDSVLSREMIVSSDVEEGEYSALRFHEDEKLYKQLDAFLREHKLSSDAVVGNDEVTQYLGGEAPSSIYEIVKYGLTNEEGNFTYIVLKLQSDYNLAYNGMIFRYVYLVFS